MMGYYEPKNEEKNYFVLLVQFFGGMLLRPPNTRHTHTHINPYQQYLFIYVFPHVFHDWYISNLQMDISKGCNNLPPQNHYSSHQSHTKMFFLKLPSILSTL